MALAGVMERAAARGEDVDFAAIEAKADRPSGASAAAAKQNVAVIPVYGVIAHRANMVQDICGPGGTSTEMLSAAIRAATDDPTVRSIVLDVIRPAARSSACRKSPTPSSGAREEADRRGRQRDRLERRLLDRLGRPRALRDAVGRGRLDRRLRPARRHERSRQGRRQGGHDISAGKYKAEGAGPALERREATTCRAHRRLLHAVREEPSRATAASPSTPCAAATARAARSRPVRRRTPAWSTASRPSTRSSRNTPGARPRPRTRGPSRTPWLNPIAAVALGPTP
jgi:hypothetical protein